jgi:hypothetical protein
LQSQAGVPAAEPFALLCWINENDRHRLFMHRAHYVIGFGGQEREERPIALDARAPLLSRLLGYSQ